LREYCSTAVPVAGVAVLLLKLLVTTVLPFRGTQIRLRKILWI
jgi:hypothetical protein